MKTQQKFVLLLLLSALLLPMLASCVTPRQTPLKTSDGTTNESNTDATDDPSSTEKSLIDDIVSLSYGRDTVIDLTLTENDKALIRKVFNVPMTWMEGDCDCLKPYFLVSTTASLRFSVSYEGEICIYDQVQNSHANTQSEDAVQLYTRLENLLQIAFSRPITEIHRIVSYSDSGSRTCDLTEADSTALIAILERNEWNSSVAERIPSDPYGLIANGRVLEYYAEKGILIDHSGKRHIEFSKEDNDAFQKIINNCTFADVKIHRSMYYSDTGDIQNCDLTEEDSAALVAIIDRNKWNPTKAESPLSDPCLLFSNDLTLRYYADEGILADDSWHRHIKFSEEDNDAFQKILNDRIVSSAN